MLLNHCYKLDDIEQFKNHYTSAMTLLVIETTVWYNNNQHIHSTNYCIALLQQLEKIVSSARVYLTMLESSHDLA